MGEICDGHLKAVEVSLGAGFILDSMAYQHASSG
jgi:hypothetical protein